MVVLTEYSVHNLFTRLPVAAFVFNVVCFVAEIAAISCAYKNIVESKHTRHAAHDDIR